MKREFKYPTYIGIAYLAIACLVGYNATMAYKFQDGTLIIKLLTILILLYAAFKHLTASYVEVSSEGIAFRKNLVSAPKMTTWQGMKNLEIDKSKITFDGENGKVKVAKTLVKGDEWNDLVQAFSNRDNCV